MGAQANDKKNNSTPINTAVIASHAVESEPLRKQEVAIVHEVVEHKISDESLKKHIEEKPEVPNIAPDIAQAGVVSNASTSFPAYHTVKLPLSQKKIPTAIKMPVHESIRWLGTLSMYIMESTKHQFNKSHESAFRFMKRILDRELGRFN